MARALASEESIGGRLPSSISHSIGNRAPLVQKEMVHTTQADKRNVIIIITYLWGRERQIQR